MSRSGALHGQRETQRRSGCGCTVRWRTVAAIKLQLEEQAAIITVLVTARTARLKYPRFNIRGS